MCYVDTRIGRVDSLQRKIGFISLSLYAYIASGVVRDLSESQATQQLIGKLTNSYASIGEFVLFQIRCSASQQPLSEKAQSVKGGMSIEPRGKRVLLQGTLLETIKPPIKSLRKNIKETNHE